MAVSGDLHQNDIAAIRTNVWCFQCKLSHMKFKYEKIVNCHNNIRQILHSSVCILTYYYGQMDYMEPEFILARTIRQVNCLEQLVMAVCHENLIGRITTCAGERSGYNEN
ncbi:hypothetical protein RUM43_002028 [Polyplax serrata]|uniref:Uncharacterized protein n=1 Tax=Polyplax serrata TaxID=468196 RepID=A0AAN8NYP8_POLSC